MDLSQRPRSALSADPAVREEHSGRHGDHKRLSLLGLPELDPARDENRQARHEPRRSGVVFGVADGGAEAREEGDEELAGEYGGGGESGAWAVGAA